VSDYPFQCNEWSGTKRYLRDLNNISISNFQLKTLASFELGAFPTLLVSR